MAVNFFDQAKTVSAPKPAAAKKSPDEATHIDGLEPYAALAYIEKILETVKARLKEPIHDQMMDEFVEEGLRTRSKPQSFKGEDGKATASLQFQKRNSRSALSDLEIELLKPYGISTEEVGDVVETFIINPAYADPADPKNAAYFEAINEALNSKKLEVPADFIQRQVAVKKTIVKEEALSEIFNPEKWPKDARTMALKDQDTMVAVVTELARIVSTLAIRPTFAGEVKDAMEILKPHLEDAVKEDKEGAESRKATVDAIKSTTTRGSKKERAK